jgi:hypothetical protein
MPPKKAPKVNLEKRRAEYEKFIGTRDEEYDCWKDLAAQKPFFKEIGTTTYDITENYEPFFDKMFALCKAFKVKMKQKEFKYDYFRSFFFGGVGVRRDDSTDVEKNYDGLTRFIKKEDNDGSLKARRAFLDIYMALDEVNDLTEENFYELKKKMKDACTNFSKFFELHIKNHHKAIHEKLVDFLQALRNILTSNFHYSLFEYENQDPKIRKLNEFKEKALTEKFCTDLQEGFRILLMTEFIKDNPNLFILTNKFKINNWEGNRIQKYFIQPLFEDWVNLRKEMNRLYVFGENHWVVPLGENIEMTKMINQLIEHELIAERMLGSDIKRDQLNFVFNTVLYIFNTPVKDKLLGEAPDNEIVIEHVIPKLTVLRYLDHIVRITKAKRADVFKQQRMQEYLALYRNKKSGAPVDEFAMPEAIQIQDQLSDTNGRFRDTKVPFITALEDEDTPEDLEVFGRYWIWSDYFPETLRDEILKGAEMLRNINVAVRQDLADEYVGTALKVQANMQKGRAEIIKRKKEKAEPLNEKDKARPPIVWNHDDIIETKHEYRANARPYDIYLDSRVKEMNNQIEFLAHELRSYCQERWHELVVRVIGFFKEHREEIHNEIENVKLPQTF